MRSLQDSCIVLRVRLHRLTVRTEASQAFNRSSILRGVTRKAASLEVVFLFECLKMKHPRSYDPDGVSSAHADARVSFSLETLHAADNLEV